VRRRFINTNPDRNVWASLPNVVSDYPTTHPCEGSRPLGLRLYADYFEASPKQDYAPVQSIGRSERTPRKNKKIQAGIESCQCRWGGI
jgi:hypothetical protein